MFSFEHYSQPYWSGERDRPIILPKARTWAMSSPNRGGMIGVFFIAIGFLLGGTLGFLWLLRLISLQSRSSPLLAVLFVLLGFQFLLTGVLADVVAHTYYAQKKAYSVRETKGF